MSKKPGLFDRILQKAASMIFPRMSWGSLLLPRTKFDYQKEVGSGLSSSVVAAVIFWIMRRFAEAKIIIKKDDEIQKIHDILTLLKKPNPYYSGRLLRMAAAVSYSIDGNIYFLKVRNKQLKVVELWYIPYWMCEPHIPENGSQFINYYSYYPRGQEVKILPEDIIHIRFGIDPENMRKGLSPLKSLFREIFTDDEAANFSASLLKNMGVPGLVISPGSDGVSINPKDIDTIKQKYKNKFTGDNKGDPLIMTAKTDIKQFGYSPAEMDLSKLREIPEERVTAILGVPAAVVGFGTGLQQTKVGATMRELREAAYEDCIIPMQNLYADELNAQLLPEFEESPEQWAIDFDLSEIRVLQEDENARAERVRGLVKDLIITQGEARADLGYEVRPEHDIYLMPFNIVPVPAGSISEPIEQAPQEQPPKFFIPVFKSVPDCNQLKMRSDWKQQLVRGFNRSLEKLSAIFSRELQKVFNDIGDQAAEIFEDIIADRGIERLSAHEPQKKDAIDEFFADMIVDGINPQYFDYKRQYLRVANDTFDTINSITGLGVNLTDKVETEIVSIGGTRKGLVDLNSQTKAAVFKALTEARESGEGPYQAALRIRDQVAAGPWSSSAIRSKVIARTETKYAQNQSSILAYKEGGIAQVEIVDGQLPTSDAECIARNGQIISMEEAGRLDDHPNNTLSLTPVIGGINA